MSMTFNAGSTANNIYCRETLSMSMTFNAGSTANNIYCRETLSMTFKSVRQNTIKKRNK